ncbi:DapH/DapD/GlmU-related protein [Microbacterium abyssi]|uniref:DapH/DapD/GlmU-related protein n=1 Tax=Microbacterium abyssi TaxID=2782166 RepID=UPI003BF4BC98
MGRCCWAWLRRSESCCSRCRSCHWRTRCSRESDGAESRVVSPFAADFGKNIALGRRIFVNSGCRFQDQGGITIGDDCLIGHNVVIATLNHDLAPSRRADMHPAPVVIGWNVWIGANATILPGVTIGDDAVVGAASVVTKDVPAGAIAVGSPARVVRSVPE